MSRKPKTNHHIHVHVDDPNFDLFVSLIYEDEIKRALRRAKYLHRQWQKGKVKLSPQTIINLDETMDHLEQSKKVLKRTQQANLN